MWISQSEHALLLNDRLMGIRAQTEARVIAEQNKILQVNMDWLRFRTTQLEKERAQMVYQLMGVKVPVPEIEQVRVDLPGELQHPLNQLPSFEDPGDDEAKKLGYK